MFKRVVKLHSIPEWVKTQRPTRLTGSQKNVPHIHLMRMIMGEEGMNPKMRKKFLVMRFNLLL